MTYAWYALLPLLVVLRGGGAERIPAPLPITDVLRGARIEPEELKAQTGFPSAAQNLSYPSLYDYTVNTRCDDEDVAGCPRDYFYLQTTTDPDIASSFLGDQPGYVYHIRATPNFIELRSTLPTFNNGPRSKEVAVFGDIRWRQVISWEYLPHGSQTAVRDRKHTINKEYDPEMSSFSASTGQFQLAGFPAGHDAWNRDPWDDYRASFSSTRAAEEEATSFSEMAASAMGQKSLFEVSVAAMMRRITLLSAAVGDIPEWIRANNDAAACGVAARQVQRNANMVSALVRQLATFMDRHKYPEVQPLPAARAIEFKARGAAFVAMELAERKSLTEYERRIGLRRENILNGVAGATVQAMSAMTDANLAQELAHKAGSQLEIKRSRRNTLVGAGVMADDLACALTLETCGMALQSELDALRVEIIILRIHVEYSQEAADRIKQKAEELMTLALEKSRGKLKPAVVTGDLKQSIETVSKKDLVLSTPKETTKTVEMIQTIEKLDNQDLGLVEEITYAIAEIGFYALTLVPSPLAPVIQVATWARHIYRIFKYAARMAKAYRVGKLSYMSIDVMRKIAELEARTADVLQKTDRRPPPLASAYMAAMKPNVTFFNILTRLDATAAGQNWKQELETATGLRITDEGTPPKSVDAGLAAEKDTHSRLKQVKDVLQTAKAQKSGPEEEPLADAALAAFEAITSGGQATQKTLLDSLDEEQKAGRLAGPKEDKDELSYLSVVQ